MSLDVSMKQRLIGAVVLIALAVIFLPLLVKDPAPDSGVSGVSLRMPAEPQGSGDMVTEDLPLDAPGAAPAGGATGMPAPVSAPPAAPEPDAAATPTPLAAVAAGNFVVSFGSYKSVADADKVIAALRAAGLPGYREKITSGSTEVQRVRIGPFADQATAESARIRAGQLGSRVEAKVIALDAAPAPATPAAPAAPATPAAAAATAPPSKPAEPPKPTEPPKPAAAPAPAPAQPAAPAKPAAGSTEPAPTPPANPAATGFVVQIGAFASAPDATKLRDEIRRAGFNAFTDTVRGEHGSLTRVRVGPVMTRAEADALKAQVKSKTGKDGMVRSHP